MQQEYNLHLGCIAAYDLCFFAECTYPNPIGDALWTKMTNFGSSDSMRIVADVEDVRFPVHSTMKGKFGLKLQESGSLCLFRE